MIELTDAPIDVARCLARCDDQDSGGQVFFVGRVRAATRGRAVTRLEYEAYRPMAIREIERIVAAACERFAIRSLDVIHRVGTLGIGEIAVIIVANAAHRVAAFDACRFAIDELKKTVPIWKREVFADGSEWVGDRP